MNHCTKGAGDRCAKFATKRVLAAAPRIEAGRDQGVVVTCPISKLEIVSAGC